MGHTKMHKALTTSRNKFESEKFMVSFVTKKNIVLNYNAMKTYGEVEV
jgi:hypothetical protein